MSVVRFGVSLEKDLLKILDQYVVENKVSNRSQAIRYLLNNSTVEKKWKCNNIVAGSITLVYDHHKRDITNILNDIQHDYHDIILASQHFHLNHNICLEIVAVKGKASVLTDLSDKLTAVKGIRHGKLTMSRAD
jgi:CopG family transcriptional regulator, nickel-responsive regulator